MNLTGDEIEALIVEAREANKTRKKALLASSNLTASGKKRRLRDWTHARRVANKIQVRNSRAKTKRKEIANKLEQETQYQGGLVSEEAKVHELYGKPDPEKSIIDLIVERIENAKK